jgi:hypothetical protein
VTGTFYAAFRTTPSPIEASRPTGPLGPRYRIVYRLYTGEKEVTPVRQDVYPFARAGFVTFTPAGQRVFDKQVVSGWYTSPASATELFVAAGVPDRRS